MPDIPVPPEARKAAHEATTLPFAQAIETSPYELIDIGLAAAAPHIADAEREWICQLADRVEAFYPDPGAPGLTLPFADLIGDPDAS